MGGFGVLWLLAAQTVAVISLSELQQTAGQPKGLETGWVWGQRIRLHIWALVAVEEEHTEHWGP